MGSNDEDDEKPPHRVRINNAFYISDHEVTLGEYWKFVNAKGYREPIQCSRGDSYKNYGKLGRDNHPINCVSWKDVAVYIKWLNQNSSAITYRLCTEAEWEYAARAGTTSKWSCGKNESCLKDYAWYAGNNSPKGTKEVKTKQPSTWGLYDMHGNVGEWVREWACSYTKPVRDTPDGNAERQCYPGPFRVVRGGDFSDSGKYVRSAYRADYASDFGGNGFVGFRLCADP